MSGQGPNNGTASDQTSYPGLGSLFTGGTQSWTSIANMDANSAFATCALTSVYNQSDVAVLTGFGSRFQAVPRSTASRLVSLERIRAPQKTG